MESNENLSFWNMVRSDFYAMDKLDLTILKFIESLLIRPRFTAVFLFRCSSALYGKRKIQKLLSRFFWLLNYWLNGCEIKAQAKIGSGFGLIHPRGVVIGAVIIGRNVQILQHVTIGLRDFSHFVDMRSISPTEIGDDVNIFAGAVVVGQIKIGKGATIGANAVVTKDVPPYCTAVGVPARILPPREKQNLENRGK